MGDRGVGRGHGRRTVAALRRLSAGTVLAFALTACSVGGGSDPLGGTTSTRPGGATSDPSTTEARGVTSTTAAPTTTVALPDLRKVDLRAGSYRVFCPTGTGEVEVRPSGSPTETPDGRVTVDVFQPVFGDVTGDGREDVVIQITCVFADGGNASVSSVVLVTADASGPHQVGPPVDGYAPEIMGPTVVVGRSVYGDDDARCCPSTTRYVPLRFQVDHLAEGGGGRPVSTADQATTSGLGAMATGRTYADVAAAAGQAVVVETSQETGTGCAYVTLEGGPTDVAGLGDEERLRSVQVGNTAVRTKSGLGLGSTEAEVYAAFPGRVTSRPHDYVPDGHYLDFTPADSPDNVVVFDTDGTTVTHYRVGEVDWAQAVEGCL
ncbi:MAG: hypothetical protein JWM47_1512 [Acidimicrobiales bacterium]|nr:hypothetical protein [Acidimicrobiales bacterium]